VPRATTTSEPRREKPAKSKTRVILTAEQWQRELRRLETQGFKEQREFEEKREYELSCEDLRDEVVALVRNELGRGEKAAEIVHARLGCHPSTFHNWEEKRVMNPRMSKLRATARAVGYDLKLVRMSGDKRH
jgi:hypothetical protein